MSDRYAAADACRRPRPTVPPMTADALALFDTTGAPTVAPRGVQAARDYADALTRDAFAQWAEALRGYSAADRDAERDDHAADETPPQPANPEGTKTPADTVSAAGPDLEEESPDLLLEVDMAGAEVRLATGLDTSAGGATERGSGSPTVAPHPPKLDDPLLRPPLHAAAHHDPRGVGPRPAGRPEGGATRGGMSGAYDPDYDPTAPTTEGPLSLF